MMRALLRKELRDLRPWGILSVVVGLVEVFEALLNQVDLQPLGLTFAGVNDAGVAVFALMAFMIGTGIPSRELDDGTLAFLDGLPTSRSKIFIAKFVVTLSLVLLAPIVDLLAAIALHLLSRGSLDQSLRIDILLQLFALQLLVMANAVLLGAALGRLRSLTWLVTGALATLVLLLSRHYPKAMLLNPLQLTQVELTSSGLMIGREIVVAQFAFAGFALIAAWRGFVRAGHSRLATLATRPIVGAVIAIATLAVLVTAVVIVMADYTQDDSGPELAPNQPYFYPSAPAQTITAHYRFSYPSDQAQQALALAAKSDEVFLGVHRLMGVAPGELIEVDLSGSTRNTHGTAYFGRIRMQLNESSIGVLAHETTHVVAQRFAGEARDWLWQRASVINEGMADWVMKHFDASLHAADDAAFMLAVLNSRRELLIEELADPELLSSKRDEYLAYAAGEALISAMVALYGEQSLAKLLRAFADERLPKDLRGLSLWQATFQLAEMDLSAVVDEFYRDVDSAAKEHAASIAMLPRPRLRVVTDGEDFGVEVLVSDGSADASYRVRFKALPDSGSDTIDSVYAEVNQPLWRDAIDIANNRICAQVGIRVTDAYVIYEPWVCLPIRDATQIELPVLETSTAD